MATRKRGRREAEVGTASMEVVQERKQRREIIAELKRLAGRSGGVIHAEEVVQAARDESSVLHDQFDWNDDEAAEKWRLMQARRLLSVHWRELKLGDTVVSLPLYMSAHPASGTAGYVESTRLGGPAVLGLALRDLEAWAKRYTTLLAMHGIVIADDLPGLVGLKRKETA